MAKDRHSELCQKIADLYTAMGYHVRRELHIGKRQVDIAAQNEEELILTEVMNLKSGTPLITLTKEEVPSQVLEKASHPHTGSYVLKWIPCGKNCRGCPHGPYAYQVTKAGGKQTWKYLGKMAWRPNQ